MRKRVGGNSLRMQWVCMAIGIIAGLMSLSWAISGRARNVARDSLVAKGYTEVRIDQWKLRVFTGCDSSTLPYGFTAKNRAGKSVQGSVCASPFWSYVGDEW